MELYLAAIITFVIVFVYLAREKHSQQAVESFEQVIENEVRKIVAGNQTLIDFRRDLNLPDFSPLKFVKLVNAHKENRLTNKFIREVLAE